MVRVIACFTDLTVQLLMVKVRLVYGIFRTPEELEWPELTTA